MAEQIKAGYDYLEEFKDAKQGLAEQVQQLESAHQACLNRFAGSANTVLNTGEEFLFASGPSKKIIIGLTGTIGSGKNTVADYLVSQHKFESRFGSDLLAEELKKQNLPLTRDNFRNLANEIRAKGINLLMLDEKFKAICAGSKNVVVGFFRTPLEIDQLKESFPKALIIAVDAPAQLRYERATSRSSEKDQVSLAQFIEQENMEMQSTDPNKQNVSECIKKSNFKIYNDSDKVSLYNQIDGILKHARN